MNDYTLSAAEVDKWAAYADRLAAQGKQSTNEYAAVMTRYTEALRQLADPPPFHRVLTPPESSASGAPPLPHQIPTPNPTQRRYGPRLHCRNIAGIWYDSYLEASDIWLRARNAEQRMEAITEVA